MTRLYIAEKPSLGRAIAAVLPRPHKNNNGYIEVGNGDIVTWCIGHLLEQVEPDAYDEKYKKWNLADLPIIPQQWQLAPRKSARQQLGWFESWPSRRLTLCMPETRTGRAAAGR